MCQRLAMNVPFVPPNKCRVSVLRDDVNGWHETKQTFAGQLLPIKKVIL